MRLFLTSKHQNLSTIPSSPVLSTVKKSLATEVGVEFISRDKLDKLKIDHWYYTGCPAKRL